MGPKTGGRITKQEIKQDRFVSWVFYLTEQFQKHRMAVIGAVGGVVVVVVLIVLVGNRQRSQGREARELFGRASVEIRAGNASLAIIDFRKVLDEHGGSNLAELACFYLGNIYYAQRDFNEAENFYRRYLKDFGKDPNLLASARWGIAGCLEQKGEFGTASDMYYEAAKDNLRGFMAGELLSAAVRAACAAPDSARAMRAYALVEERFAKDPTVLEPVQMLLYEHKYLPPPVK